MASIAEGDAVAPEGRRPGRHATAPGQSSAPGSTCSGEELRALAWREHVGLITNATGSRAGRNADIDVLRGRPRSPSSRSSPPSTASAASRDELIADRRDEATGLPVYSLYGGRFRPTTGEPRRRQYAGLDVQDVGTRFYTYASTMPASRDARRRPTPAALCRSRSARPNRRAAGRGADPRDRRRPCLHAA